MEWVKDHLKAEENRTYLGHGRYEEWNEYHIPNCSWGDYGGSTVDRANCATFHEKYPEFVTLKHGGHGSEWAIVMQDSLCRMAVRFDEFREDVEGLENYPVLDEEKLSEIENELETESWKDFYADEFVKALAEIYADRIEALGEPAADVFREKLDEMDGGDQVFGLIWEIFQKWREFANEYWEPESAVASHINIEQIVEDVGRNPMLMHDTWDQLMEFVFPAEVATSREAEKQQLKFSFYDDPAIRLAAESLVRALLANDLLSGIKSPLAEALVKDLLMEHDYSCLMVPLPDNLRAAIQKWSLANIPEKDLYVDGDEDVKGREDESHTTLKYGLTEPSPSKSLLDVLRMAKPFEVALEPISIFRQDNYDVIKLGVTSPALRALNALVCQTCPNEDKYPEYNPHCTICYVKSGCGDRFEGVSPWDWTEKLGVSTLHKNGKFIAREVVFSSKDGKKSTIPFGE
jgi:hypothetical protein